MKKNNKGFTLVEIIVVMAIIAILSAVMIPGITIYIEKTKKSNDNAIASAMTDYLQVTLDSEKMNTAGNGFNLDVIVDKLLKEKLSLDSKSKYRFVYCYDANKVVAVDQSKLTTPDNSEVLFPDEWQVNNLNIIKKYGYFVSFNRYKVEYNDKEFVGYDITYDKDKYLPYDSVPGLYTDKNKLLLSIDELRNGYGIFGEIGNGKIDNIKLSKTDANSDTFKDGTKLIIPESVQASQKITLTKYNAHLNNSYLKQIFLPDTVTEFTGNFADNFELEYVRLPSKLENLGNSTFMGTPKLKYIHLPENLTSLGTNCFSKDDNESGLKHLIIPDCITTINANALDGCTNLESIAFSRKLSDVANDAFKNCTSLKTIFMNLSLERIDEDAFDVDLTNLEIYFEGSKKRWSALLNSKLSTARVYYYSATSEISDADVYWHYQNFIIKEW